MRGRFRLQLAVVLFCFLFNYCISYAGESKYLYAVIAFGNSSKYKADFVLTQGSNDGIRFVEREMLNKIIGEQKLSASGLVDPQSLVKVGRLLKADIIVSIVHDRRYERLIIFDVSNGIRLSDHILDDVNIMHDVMKILDYIRQSEKRLCSVKDKSVKFISFMPVSMISRRKEALESTTRMQMFIKQGLLNYSDFTLLERDLIDLLIEENLIDQSALDNLKSSYYIIEFESQDVDTKNHKIKIIAYLKNSKGKIKDELKFTYNIGEEQKAASQLIKAFYSKVKVSKIYSRSDRKLEAMAFLDDSREALKNYDYEKSVLSLKNAYMLYPRLLPAINKILTYNVEYYRMVIKNKESSTLSKMDMYKVNNVANCLIALLKFYYKVNGKYYDGVFNIRCFAYMPEGLQNRIREYSHIYTLSRIAGLKKKYNYNVYPRGSVMYFNKFASYLRELRKVVDYDWTCMYWMKYMAPELRQYIEDMSHLPLNTISKIDYVHGNVLFVPKYFYFYDDDRLFCSDVFDEVIALNELIYNSNVLMWKIDARGNITQIKNMFAKPLRMQEAISIYRKFYHRNLFVDINMAFCNNEFGYHSKGGYDFLKYLSIQSNFADANVKKACESYFIKHATQYLYIDKQFNKDLFLIAMDAKYNNFFRKLVYTLHKIWPEPKKVDEYISITKQLDDIKKIAIKNGYLDGVGIIDARLKEVAKIDREHERLKTEIQFDEYFEKCIDVGKLCHKIIENSPQAFKGAIERDGIVYLCFLRPKYFGYETFLMKIDVNNDFKADIGAMLDINKSSGHKYINNVFCETPESVIYFRDDSGLIVYHKDGKKPEFIKYSGFNKRNVWGACFSKSENKIYMLLTNCYDSYNKRPFEIVEYDFKNNNFKVIFSAGQQKDNPFLKRKYKEYMLGHRIFFDNKKRSLIFSKVTGNSRSDKNEIWEFQITTGKLDLRYVVDEHGETQCFSENTFAHIEKDGYLRLFDYSLDKSWLIKHVINYRLKRIDCSNESFNVAFTLDRNLYIGDTFLDEFGIWSRKYYIFMKQRRVFEFKTYDNLLSFTNKKQVYSLFSRHVKGKLNIYLGKFKSKDLLIKRIRRGIEVESL